jgi:hypothetical protein
MNNRILAALRPTPLVRVWRSTGEPGMPLISTWVQAKTAKLRTNDAALSSDEKGGLCLCA